MAGQWDGLSDSDANAALQPTDITANGVTTSNINDGAPAYAVTYWLHTVAITDGDYALGLLESDTITPTDFTTVPDSMVYNPVQSFDNTRPNDAFGIGYLGSKRYTRLTITATNVTTGLENISVIAIRSFGKNTPINRDVRPL